MTHQVEIIAIGNEILKGAIVNSNAAEIASALFKNGYSCHQQLVIPDDRVLIKEQLRNSLKRSSIVVTTGGLGPTCDDITRQAAAEVFDSGFALNEDLAKELKQRYGDLPISLNDQATVPVKASILKNPLGTAPGIVFNTDQGTLILMPGVPKEMRTMLHEQVIPFLKTHFPVLNPSVSRSIHFFGIGESSVDPFLRKLEAEYPQVEFGIYPSHGLISITASIHKPNLESSDELASIISVLKKEFETHFYSDSSEKIEEAIQTLFTNQRWTLSLAESCTGGAIAARLTRSAGASNYFLGSLVAYSNPLKEKLLYVDPKIISAKGAVSEETVQAMALGVLDVAGSDFSIAISGIAGPTGGTENCPVGTVWIALAGKNQPVKCRKIRGFGNREMIIEQSVNSALGLLYQYAASL